LAQDREQILATFGVGADSGAVVERAAGRRRLVLGEIQQ
jgi:hypothetical protein